jgi:endonuclease-3 related protein
VSPTARPLDAARLDAVYEALLGEYGPQGWWPVLGPPEQAAIEVCVGAILVQHTTWERAAGAIARLREAGALSVEALASRAAGEIEALLRGAGTYRAKARRLRSFADQVLAGPDGTIEGFLGGEPAAVRRRCLAVWGVGPETADAIVLYAAGLPTFVVDAYARRLLGRLEIEVASGYELARRALRDAAGDATGDAVGGDEVARLGEWHALIVAHGKARCTARRPRCEGCPLLAGCPEGQRLAA